MCTTKVSAREDRIYSGCAAGRVHIYNNTCIRWPRKVLKTPTPSPAADASALACTAVMGLDFNERGIYTRRHGNVEGPKCERIIYAFV